MATWKCFVCNWDNAGKWEKCAKCGTIHVPNATNADAQLFSQLRAEVKKVRDDIVKYKITVARKWEYFQISSDEIQGSSGLANLGSQGWELIAITSYSEGGGMVLNGVGGSSYAIKFMYIFKRPIPEIPSDLLTKFQDVLNRTPNHLRDALRKIENV
jgi:hypothetical protein